VLKESLRQKKGGRKAYSVPKKYKNAEVLKESLRQKKRGQKRVFCPQEIQK
jgi:hypothetical protein